MAENEGEFSTLMRRAREGSEEAVRTLVEEYGHHILRVVRHRLHEKLRPRFDSADFVQDVWASVFAAPDRALIFNDPEALILFLAAMARNKVVDSTRQCLRTARYDVSREEPLENVPSQSSQFASPDPTPSQAAIGQEEWQRLVQDEPPGFENLVADRLEGLTCADVARRFGVSERTVRRVLARLAEGRGP